MNVPERVRISERKCTCRMAAGDAWAVRQAGILIGYYVACPFCAMVNVVLADEQEFFERGRGAELVLSFKPGHACTRCRRRFRIEEGRFAEA